ncbi:MAG: FHA domain-containing protein [Lachnospiraceae bacterium]|nr:FHA domain-containing protein [Lachnospiraceae bacterium]
MDGIRILNGRYEGAEIAMDTEQELVIGRDVHQCQFVIESAWVSRVHLRIRYDGKKYLVTDQSRHGTFYTDSNRLPNGVQVECNHNTVLNIGRDGIGILLI